jgi:hypothetical protein
MKTGAPRSFSCMAVLNEVMGNLHIHLNNKVLEIFHKHKFLSFVDTTEFHSLGSSPLKKHMKHNIV